jgi:hypothetical protein
MAAGQNRVIGFVLLTDLLDIIFKQEAAKKTYYNIIQGVKNEQKPYRNQT